MNFKKRFLSFFDNLFTYISTSNTMLLNKQNYKICSFRNLIYPQWSAGNTLSFSLWHNEEPVSPMGYGINKKFLCKLDPEYNSNGSYDFCSTSQKQVVSRVHNTQLNTYYISKYIDGKKEEGTKKDFYIYSDGSGYTKTRNQPEKWVEHNLRKDFFHIFCHLI